MTEVWLPEACWPHLIHYQGEFVGFHKFFTVKPSPGEITKPMRWSPDEPVDEPCGCVVVRGDDVVLGCKRYPHCRKEVVPLCPSSFDHIRRS